MVITPSSLPSGTENDPYVENLNAHGGTAPYSWSADGLPDGLAIDADSGVIRGTPIAEGGYAVHVTVVDVSQDLASRDYTLKIIREENQR